MQTPALKNMINCKGKLLSIGQPLVMGILNATPDSFYDGGKNARADQALKNVEKMLNEGAAIIDVGGQSTRPGAEMVSETEELNRVIPIIEKIVIAFPDAVLSVDTFRAGVARQALQAGAAIINDVSAGDDDAEMFPLILKQHVPYILMHKKGKPTTMQQNPVYQNVVAEILNYFLPKVNYLRQQGLNDIIIDPGFGFGKTLEHNYQLLGNLDVLTMLGCPVLVGMSRKKMIQNVLHTDAARALNGTTAAHMMALQKGARILRVHDVKEAREAISIYLETSKINSFF